MVKILKSTLHKGFFLQQPDKMLTYKKLSWNVGFIKSEKITELQQNTPVND